MRGAALALLLAAAGCEAAAPGGEASSATPAGASMYAPAGLASSGRLPERYGFGRAATAEEIARLDVDVMPDGRGLPPGRGTPVQGAEVYTARCAICHGAQGEGTPLGMALVGRNPGDSFRFESPDGADRPKTIGNYWPYATTLFDYIRRAMPFDRPGSLSDEEVYAVSAYLLYRNEIIDREAVLDAGTLPRVRMPARDRFVPDDREGTTGVR